ncbi:MAG: PAS domain S-box protein [Bacteroidales bacterium]|nr:PAS domain S-box protein [Bacteroidales bacterium]
MTEPIRILFVEDVPYDMELAGFELKKAGIDFVSMRVDEEKDLILALKSFLPTLVICDYAMPRFDGMEALKIILSHDNNLPVIMFTGSQNEMVAVECMKVGASDYILKDNIKRLPYAVREALEKKELWEARNRAEEERAAYLDELKTLNTDLFAARHASLNIMEDLHAEIEERKKAEEALQESEDRFRSIFEKTASGYMLTALDGQLILVNNAFANMLGYTIDELQSLRFQDITHPDDMLLSEECIRKLLTNKENICQFEKRYFTRNGSAVWTFIMTTLLHNSEGSPLYFVTSITDITGLKLIEDELKLKINELERFNDLTVDREFDMIDLKKEINELLKRIGEKEKYRIVGQ